MDPSAFPNLDPELAPLLELLPDMSDGLDDLPAARAMLESFAHGVEIDETGVQWEDVDGCRVYRPDAAAGVDVGGLLYLHGGGFCLGSVALEHLTALTLCRDLGVVVVSVDYRLAPEHPYPAGLEDCYAGLQLLAGLAGVRADRLAVHGLSAGGGLAAAVALLARDRGGPALCFQSLNVPEIDDRLDTPSMRAGDTTPLWSRPQARRSWEHYLGGQEADQYAAPARATDLTGLPPAYVVTCELDPLRDEGLTYAMRLLEAGVSVEIHSFPGTFHGVQIAVGTQVVERMDRELLDVLRRRLAPDPVEDRVR